MFLNEGFICFLLDECVFKEFFEGKFLFSEILKYGGVKEFVVEKDFVVYWYFLCFMIGKIGELGIKYMDF